MEHYWHSAPVSIRPARSLNLESLLRRLLSSHVGLILRVDRCPPHAEARLAFPPVIGPLPAASALNQLCLASPPDLSAVSPDMEGLHRGHGVFAASIAVMLFVQDAFASILKPQFFSTPASLNASSPPLSTDLEGRLSPLISRLLALIGVDPARPLSVSDMAKISLICGLIPGLLLHRHRVQKKGDDNSSLSDTIGQGGDCKMTWKPHANP